MRPDRRRNYEGCTKAQSISRYLTTEVGRWLFQASKVAPPEIDKKASYLADERLGTISLEEARRLGDKKIHAKDIDMPLRGVGDVRTEAQQASRGLAGANTPRVGSPRAGSGTRKTDAEKERSMRQYLASPGSWPQI